MKRTLKLMVFWGLSVPLFGQGITLPEDAIRAVLENHPLSQAAAYGVQAKRYSEKTALNISNPEISAESPTGEFYTIGVSQSFEFPTVYARQKQVAKAATGLAQSGQQVQENDLRYNTRSLYLEAQAAAFQADQWGRRDSLYQAISAAAIRQFDAGEIDFLQKTMAENEAGKTHQEYLAAGQTASLFRQELATYTGLNEIQALEPLRADTAGLFSMAGMAGNPSIAYEQQAQQLAERQISLAKSQALPNFSVGYMNQAARNSPIDYRFRASIGVPLWAGQYNARIKAAKAETQAAASRTEAQTRATAIEQKRARSEALIALAQIQYLEKEALPRSQSLIAAALRLREAGQVDYVSFLRTLDEAFSTQREYAQQLQAFNAAHYRLMYLSGQ